MYSYLSNINASLKAFAISLLSSKNAHRLRIRSQSFRKVYSIEHARLVDTRCKMSLPKLRTLTRIYTHLQLDECVHKAAICQTFQVCWVFTYLQSFNRIRTTIAVGDRPRASSTNSNHCRISFISPRNILLRLSPPKLYRKSKFVLLSCTSLPIGATPYYYFPHFHPANTILSFLSVLLCLSSLLSHFPIHS